MRKERREKNECVLDRAGVSVGNRGKYSDLSLGFELRPDVAISDPRLVMKSVVPLRLLLWFCEI